MTEPIEILFLCCPKCGFILHHDGPKTVFQEVVVRKDDRGMPHEEVRVFVGGKWQCKTCGYEVINPETDIPQQIREGTIQNKKQGNFGDTILGGPWEGWL